MRRAPRRVRLWPGPVVCAVVGVGPAASAPSAAAAGDWRQVSTGGTHVCAIRADDSLGCRGRNDSGRLGEGTTTRGNLPVLVG